MASQLLEALGSIITQVENIPYEWPVGVDMPIPGQLFQWVAMWNNQVKQWEDGATFPVQRPCCFIEINMGRASAMGLGITLYKDVRIKFHIVDWQIDAGDGTLDQNAEIFIWRDLLKTNMERFFPLHCGAMTTLKEDQDYRHTGIYHYIITFRTSLSDLKGSVLDEDQTKVILTPPPGPDGSLWGWQPTINLEDESSWPPPDPE